jgi:hypothetical protein
MAFVVNPIMLAAIFEIVFIRGSIGQINMLEGNELKDAVQKSILGPSLMSP